MQTVIATLAEDTEYVDNTLQTASWWDKYTLKAGEYEVEWTTIDGRPVQDATQAYYGMVRVDATLDETYRVNRVFTASSAEHKTDLGQARHKYFQFYRHAVVGYVEQRYPFDSHPYGLTFREV